jgi:membrane protein implicated in regulation of membrane protease activity
LSDVFLFAILLLLIGLHVVDVPVGLVLLLGAAVFELAEKAFWFWRTRGIPLAVGVEAMVGQPVTVIAPCRPEGRVRFGSESWKARCRDGAAIGERLVIDAVENLTLVVR